MCLLKVGTTPGSLALKICFAALLFVFDLKNGSVIQVTL